MYKLIFSQTSIKQLKQLGGPISSRLLATLERIRIRPERYLKKLVGDSAYKLRVGNYRIIVDLDKGKLVILILQVGHRRNIYK